MTSKADFTPEEWTQLLQAPIIAGMVITLASPAIGDTMKESMAVAKTLSEAAVHAEGEGLYVEWVSEYKDKDKVKEAQPKFERTDINTVIAKAVDDVRSAAALLDDKADAEEAAQIKGLIYTVAVASAQAAKEGDFMGIGGVRVNDAEKAALADLASILNVPQ